MRRSQQKVQPASRMESNRDSECTEPQVVQGFSEDRQDHSGHPGDWITPVGPDRTPTVHWGRYDGRPWVAQPHEHAHATQVTDTSVEHGWRPHKLGSGVKVRGTEAW